MKKGIEAGHNVISLKEVFALQTSKEENDMADTGVDPFDGSQTGGK